jgi:hypothetical protein
MADRGSTPTRGQLSRARVRRQRLIWAAVLALVGVGGLTWLAAANDPASRAPTASVRQGSASTRAVPPACADALGVGRRLADSADAVAQAAERHLELMERLDLFLEHKPGGLSGKQVYELGQQQMHVFEHHAKPTRALVRDYREVAAACPLK